MSTNDDNPIAAFRRDAEAAQSSQGERAGRSAADDIIEVVGDLGHPKTRNRGCPQCGSEEATTTRPLGSAPRNRCTSCGHKWLGSPRSPAKLILAKNGPAQTSVSGPYYKGSSVRHSVDKNSPKSRLKAKNLTALKEKLK
jgi:DNA-directed RNA polymerase subunit RPC12/RpoP